MTRSLLITLLLLLSGPDDGSKKGRQGNAHYDAGQYPEAAEAYRAGLAAADAPPAVRYGLQNNLGSALLQSGDAEAAGEAFDEAQRLAPTQADLSRAAYNGGNAAYARDDLEAALDTYRRALLADPGNEDAKFNYEFVKRKLDEQQQQQSQEQNQQQEQNPQEQNQDGESGDSGEDPQEQDQQQQPQEQNQDGERQDGEPQDQGESPGPQERRPQETPQPGQLSREQAERMLQALQDEEEQLLRQQQRPPQRGISVEKDW